MALLVASGGFALIRPDWFHLQNGLDPFFYVGLSLNLEDFISQGGDAHYFISRWTLYLPELLFTRLLGSSAGFVAMRICLLALVAWAIIYLRHRSDRWLDSIVVTLAVAFSPLVLRAVFVDYSDAIVVPFGLACVVGSVQARVRLRSAALLAAAASIAVIANFFAIFMVSISLGAYLWRARRVLLKTVAVFGGSAALVGLAGLAFFRVKFGIVNVYEPTIRFITDFISQNVFASPYTSPTLAWLGYRLWIYLPLLILLTAWGLTVSGIVKWSERDRLIFGICALQFVFQILYQFIMDGPTLEIHYYFSYMIPAYSAALAVVLYATLRRCSTRDAAVLGGFLIAGLIAFSFLPATHMRSWLDLVIILAVLGAVAYWFSRRFPVIIPAALIVVAFAVQTRFPIREPRLLDQYRVPAGYESVFARGPSRGVKAFQDVAVFLERMDGLGDTVEDETGFILCGGLGHPFGASYATHVAAPSHWLNPPGTEEAGLGFAVARMEEQGYTHVAVLCSPDEIDGVVAALDDAGLTLDDPLLHYTVHENLLDPQLTTEVLVASVS